MLLLKKTLKVIREVNEWIGNKVAWLTAALVLLFCYDVITRYFFNFTKVWIGELEWHLFSLIFLLGAGYTLKYERHVRVDLFYNKFSPKKKAWINIIGTVIFLVPWSLILIYTSFNYANISFSQMEGSPNPGGLPYRFIIKFAITAGFVFFLLQGIALLIESIMIINNYSEDPD